MSKRKQQYKQPKAYYSQGQIIGERENLYVNLNINHLYNKLSKQKHC